jgi:hypothetical protein
MPQRAGCALTRRLTAGACPASILSAMPQPSNIYVSTVRRKRAVWPYALAVLCMIALLAAVLLGGL